MKLVVCVVMVVYVVVIAAITVLLRKAPESNIVRLPIFYYWVSVIAGMAVGVTMYLSADAGLQISLAWFAELLIMAGTAAMCLWIANWRIVYDDNGFTSRDILGHEMRYSYDAVLSAKSDGGNTQLTIKNREKPLSIHMQAKNTRDFLMICKKKHEAALVSVSSTEQS